MTRKIQDVMKLRAVLALSIAAVALIGAIRLERADCFAGDSLCKLVQAVSLRESGFRSDALVYPGGEIDPDYTFYPFQGVYHRVMNGRHIGPFPLLFSVVGAVYSFVLPYRYFIIAGVLVFLGIVWLFSRVTDSAVLLLLFASGSPLYLQSLEFSENIYTALAGAVGTLLFVRALREEKPSAGRLIAAGLLLGACVFLRPEAALIAPAYAAGMIWHFRRTLASVWRPALLFLAPAAGAVALFAACNILLYGAPGGPRADANPMGWSPAEKLIQAGTLLFAGRGQLGFFGYMPAGLALLYAAIRSSDRVVNILGVGLVLFLIAVALLVPHTGVVNWGPRFLIQAVFPLFVIYASWHAGCPSRRRRALMVGLFLPALVMTYIGYGISRAACKQLRQYQTEFRAAQGDIWIFSDMILSGSTGTDFLEKPVYLARSRPDMRKLAGLLSTRKGMRLVYFAPIIPEELKHMAPPELLNREDFSDELAARFQKGPQTQGRFIRSTVFEVP